MAQSLSTTAKTLDNKQFTLLIQSVFSLSISQSDVQAIQAHILNNMDSSIAIVQKNPMETTILLNDKKCHIGFILEWVNNYSACSHTNLISATIYN